MPSRDDDILEAYIRERERLRLEHERKLARIDRLGRLMIYVALATFPVSLALSLLIRAIRGH